MLLDAAAQVDREADIVEAVVLVERVHAVLRSNEVGDFTVVLLERRNRDAFKEPANKWLSVSHQTFHPPDSRLRSASMTRPRLQIPQSSRRRSFLTRTDRVDAGVYDEKPSVA